MLKLGPLEEPSEEIESTDRGLAFHRALSRLHTALRQAGVHQPEEAVDGHLHARLEEAVNECAVRGSPAAEALWRLEGRRLQRMAVRYRPHWQKFVEPWLLRGVRPRPEFFEVGFGLPGADGETVHGPLVITGAGVEVRISGRIDRVDLAELPGGGVGFWIIDYKTGRSAHYTGGDLKEFRRLQLTLYALAVQDVLLAGHDARPLGLAYWLVTDTGPKVALPGHPRHLAWGGAVDLRVVHQHLPHDPPARAIRGRPLSRRRLPSAARARSRPTKGTSLSRPPVRLSLGAAHRRGNES